MEPRSPALFCLGLPCALLQQKTREDLVEHILAIPCLSRRLSKRCTCPFFQSSPDVQDGTHPSPHTDSDTLHGPRLRAALASLDPFSVNDGLLQPCSVFRIPPAFCKPQLRRALRFGLCFIRDDATGPDPSAPSFSSENTPRVWKFGLFLPRMLRFRPAGTDRVPKPVILARFSAFFRRDWETLLRAAMAGATHNLSSLGSFGGFVM